MTSSSSPKKNRPNRFKTIEPETFMAHAENLLKFEWQHHRSPSNWKPGKKKVSSLINLAIDGIESAEETVESSSPAKVIDFPTKGDDT